MASLGSGIQYSVAQDIPGKIETPNLPPSVKDENGGESKVQGGESKVQGGEPTLKDDGQSQVQPQPQQAPAPPDYRIKVQFHSITIHDDEEPAPFDDGEYTMRAVVNGKYVNLDKGSGGKLWDVSPGETVYFAPYTSATVEIPSEGFPISIYTLGYEADPCPRIGYGEDVDPRIMPILKGPESEWLSDIRRIIDQDINGPHRNGDLSCHDSIGFVNKIFRYYEGGVIKYVKSTNADDPDNPNAKPNFTLWYSIQRVPK